MTPRALRIEMNDAGRWTTQGRAVGKLRVSGFAFIWVALGKLLSLSGFCCMRSILGSVS